MAERSGGVERRLLAHRTPTFASGAVREANADQRQPAPANCHAGGRGFEYRRSHLDLQVFVGLLSVPPPQPSRKTTDLAWGRFETGRVGGRAEAELRSSICCAS